IVHHPDDGVLELRWLPSAMTDNAFKATLARYAWEAEQIRPTSLLIDATEFRHTFGPGVMEWRNDAIIPRYGAAGVRKFAFHVSRPRGWGGRKDAFSPRSGAPGVRNFASQFSAGFPGPIESGGKEAIDGPAIFPPAWFSPRQNAVAWLKSA